MEAHPLDATPSPLSTALEVQAIPRGIRNYLTNQDLKKLVLVNQQWWRAFAPFLWEKLFVNETDEDRVIILRNGQVVQELTVLIHELESKERIHSLIESLAKSCPNISTLHLKLYSALQFDPTSGRPLEDTDSHGSQPLQALQTMHHLLSHFPNLNKLNLHLAHRDLPATVVLAATQLPYLHELGIFGGLKQKAYTLHKNKRCDWDALFWTMVKCPRLRTLRVSWRDQHYQQQPLLAQQQLQDALLWIDQAELASSSASSTLPAWFQNHLRQVSEAHLPTSPIMNAPTPTTSTTDSAAPAPQLKHLRELHLDNMECPPLQAFQRLLYHCCHLYAFSADLLAHGLDQESHPSSDIDIAVTKLRLLLEHCGPSLRRLDLARLTLASMADSRTVYYHHRGIGNWELWTPVLASASCQALRELSIYAPAMGWVSQPEHLQWVTRLTVNAIDDVDRLNNVMARGLPALTHVVLEGSIVFQRGYHWQYNAVNGTWVFSPEPEQVPKQVHPWLARATLQHVDVSRLAMDNRGEIEGLYDVVRSLDRLETLALPISHLEVLEELTRSLEGVSTSTSTAEGGGLSFSSLSISGQALGGETSGQGGSAATTATASTESNKPLHAALKTQVFPHSLHTLRIMHNVETIFQMPKTSVIQVKKQMGTVVFEKMPGVRIIQVDQMLMGEYGRLTPVIASRGSDMGPYWLSVPAAQATPFHQDEEQEQDEDEEPVPELDQPADRVIQYQIVSKS